MSLFSCKELCKRVSQEQYKYTRLFINTFFILIKQVKIQKFTDLNCIQAQLALFIPLYLASS